MAHRRWKRSGACPAPSDESEAHRAHRHPGEIVLVIHWIGGIRTELRLPRRRRGQRKSASPNLISAIRQLVLIANDDLLAGILNRNGLTTGRGNRWTRERVTALRSYHKIPVYRPQTEGIEPRPAPAVSWPRRWRIECPGKPSHAPSGASRMPVRPGRRHNYIWIGLNT